MSIDLPGIIAAIKAALPIAEQLAKISKTLWDDRAVALLTLILQHQALIDFLMAIIATPAVVESAGPARTEAIAAAANQHGNATVQAVVSQAGFDWSQLLSYLPVIVRLILTTLGARS